MNKTTCRQELNRPCSLLLAACLALPLLLAGAQAASAQGPVYSVTDSGAFYRVWQATLWATNSVTGQVTPQARGYTELADGLNAR